MPDRGSARKLLYVVASYRGITVFTQEIRKKIRTRSSEYLITLISEEEEVVCRIDKNLITEVWRAKALFNVKFKNNTKLKKIMLS